MSRPEDHAYYSRRAAEETERGNQATGATAAAIHYELADRYSILAARPGTGGPNLTLVDCGKDQLAA